MVESHSVSLCALACTYICVQRRCVTYGGNQGELLQPTSKLCCSSSLLIPTFLYFLLFNGAFLILIITTYIRIMMLVQATLPEICLVNFRESLLSPPRYSFMFLSFSYLVPPLPLSRFPPLPRGYVESAGCWGRGGQLFTTLLNAAGCPAFKANFLVLLCNPVVSKLNTHLH